MSHGKYLQTVKVTPSGSLVGYTAGAYPCFNDMKRLGSCHSPLPGDQSDTGHCPSLMAGTHLQLSQLKQCEAKSLA